MPRNITHVILADEAADIIKSKDIFDNPEAFHMGCVADIRTDTTDEYLHKVNK